MSGENDRKLPFIYKLHPKCEVHIANQKWKRVGRPSNVVRLRIVNRIFESESQMTNVRVALFGPVEHSKSASIENCSPGHLF